VKPNSIDISKGINVMRGHVDANGSIALHEGPAEQTYVLYVISGTGKMTLNDKDGKQYGEVTYKPDDVLLFNPHTWHGWVNGDTAFEFLGFDMQAPKK
jgi:quercetin dioxygenase-like cupin family protein